MPCQTFILPDQGLLVADEAVSDGAVPITGSNFLEFFFINVLGCATNSDAVDNNSIIFEPVSHFLRVTEAVMFAICQHYDSF